MIYYVRHGESIDNMFDTISDGKRDSGITPYGVYQAKRAGEKLKDIKFDVCYCSPLQRSTFTAHEILKFHPNLKATVDDRLIERNYGKASGKLISKINKKEYEKRYMFDTVCKIKGIETVEELYERVVNFFDDIIEKHKDKNVLIVGHGGFARLAYCYFNGVPENKDLSDIKLRNAEILEFNPQKEITRIEEELEP